MSVEKSADDGRLIFLFEVSNFYVTNITVCAIIKNDISENDFCGNESIFIFFYPYTSYNGNEYLQS